MAYDFAGSGHDLGHDETLSLTTPEVREVLDKHGWKFHESDSGESDGSFASRTYTHPDFPHDAMVFSRMLGGGEFWCHENYDDDSSLGEDSEGYLKDFPKYLDKFHSERTK